MFTAAHKTDAKAKLTAYTWSSASPTKDVILFWMFHIK